MLRTLEVIVALLSNNLQPGFLLYFENVLFGIRDFKMKNSSVFLIDLILFPKQLSYP